MKGSYTFITQSLSIISEVTFRVNMTPIGVLAA